MGCLVEVGIFSKSLLTTLRKMNSSQKIYSEFKAEPISNGFRLSFI